MNPEDLANFDTIIHFKNNNSNKTLLGSVFIKENNYIICKNKLTRNYSGITNAINNFVHQLSKETGFQLTLVKNI
jgi:hypothetical protein